MIARKHEQDWRRRDEGYESGRSVVVHGKTATVIRPGGYGMIVVRFTGQTETVSIHYREIEK
jgi:hypothetical protein